MEILRVITLPSTRPVFPSATDSDAFKFPFTVPKTLISRASTSDFKCPDGPTVSLHPVN